ncbi:MAG TPA: uracil-DNA glycosylase family protein [Chthoniobacterales bacterium]|nr:uracil-DNA glycosylase family protein [Chthoniobacterales bacterium]
MARPSLRQRALDQHVAALLQCRRCPRMLPPPVSGGPVLSQVMLVGQAPGVKEPVLGRPFAWTAGRTLFGWFAEFCALTETQVRARIYFAAVCRCFPGKNSAGGDRVPVPDEIRNCAAWLNDELEILRPRLVIPVGKLAISQFMAVDKLDQVIGRVFPMQRNGHAFDLVPLPHPSGASPWHRIMPGKALLGKGMRQIARHPAMVDQPVPELRSREPRARLG